MNSKLVYQLLLVFIVATVVGYFGRLLFASKCERFECCYGLLRVDRTTKEESKDIEMHLQFPKQLNLTQNVQDL